MFSSFFHFGLYPASRISYIAVPHFSFLILSFRESDGNNFYNDDRIGIY